MNRFLLVLPILLTAWLGPILAGCATISRPGGINVSVTNLLPTQAAMFETGAALTLRLTNEMPEARTMIGSSHRLYLNDSYVGRAVSNERITVPPLGTVTQTVTVYLENLTLVRKMMELANTNRPIISYRLESQLHSAEGSRDRTLATTSKGELDLTALIDGTNPLAERRLF